MLNTLKYTLFLLLLSHYPHQQIAMIVLGRSTGCYGLWLKIRFNYTYFYRYRLTQVAVDAQVKTPGGKTYDVIFVGTGK